MKIFTFILTLFTSLILVDQVRPAVNSQTISTSGATISIPNENGELGGAFELKFSGAPGTVNVVIKGCALGGTCDTLDTYTTVADSIRKPLIAGPYKNFTATASWTGGTSPSVKVNSMLGKLPSAALYIYADATTGNDSNSGSWGQPVLTLEKARSLAANHSKVAVLGCGTFYLTSALIMTSADSNVLWTKAGYCQSDFRISGGQRLTGWVNTSGNIWTHTGVGLSDAEVLFYDGAFRYNPRLGSGTKPEGTQYRIASLDGVNKDRFFYDVADAAVQGAWTNLNNNNVAGCDAGSNSYPVGNITGSYMSTFQGSRFRVKCRNTTTHELFLTGNIEANTSFVVGRRFTIENVENAVGAAPQWYWNKSTNVITYYAAPGEDPNAHEVIIPQVAPPLISVTGLTDATFRAITFSHDNLVMGATGYQGQQSEFTLESVFHCMNCSRNTFDFVTFTATTSYALRIDTNNSGTCTSNTVKNSLFQVLGAGGLLMGRFPPTVNDTDTNICQNNAALNNRVHAIGRVYPFAGAIASLLEQHTRILHNEVDDGYSYAIVNCIPSPANCGSSTTAGPIDTEIAWNKCYNFGQGLTYDFGCIYTVPYAALGNSVHDNIVHHVNDASKRDVAFGFSTSSPGGVGIYIDNLSQDVNVYNNLVYKTTGPNMRSSRGPQTDGHPNIIANNILALSRTGAFIQGLAPPGVLLQVILRDNLIYFDKTYSDTPAFLVNFNCSPFGGTLTLVQLWNPNLYFNPNTDISAAGYTNLFNHTNASCSNIGVYSKATWVAAGEDASGLFNVNPGFVDVAHENFALSGASPLGSFIPFDLGAPGLESPNAVPAVTGTVPPGWPTFDYVDADY